MFVYHRRHFNESMMNDLKKLKYPIDAAAAVATATAVVASASPSPSSPPSKMKIVAKKSRKKHDVIKLQSSLKNAFDFR